MQLVGIFIACLLCVVLIGGLYIIRKKNIHIWLCQYLAGNLNRIFSKEVSGKKHIIFCLVDHFEPYWNNASTEVAQQRIKAWIDNYPQMAKKHCDSNGNPPQHTFFYPEEEYIPEDMDKLAKLCKEGFGEVEIHLHHDNDTSDNLRKTIEGFKKKLASHGLLGKDQKGNVSYGFIHGNWALDNSHSEGKNCGVNDEMEL